MNLLDDATGIERLDPGGMRGHLEGFPQHLGEALEIGRTAKLTVSGSGVSSVVVFGMGGSAIGGELAGGSLFEQVGVPFEVVRGYAVPAHVGTDTLAVVSSYSGNTEETLAAYSAATARGSRIVCSTTGGEVAHIAETAGHDLVRIPGGLPPRAALAYSLIPLIVILSRLGLISDRADEIDAAARAATRAVELFGVDSPTTANAAKDLALWLHGWIPVVYGTPPRTSVIANRWAGQFSENAKVVAHRNELPEMNHNEVVGWSGERPLGGAARVVFLRDADDHQRVVRRIEITREEIARSGAESRAVESFGDSALARLVSLVLLGDFASFYLAVLGGVDPTPVKPIDRLKAALAAM